MIILLTIPVAIHWTKFSSQVCATRSSLCNWYPILYPIQHLLRFHFFDRAPRPSPNLPPISTFPFFIRNHVTNVIIMRELPLSLKCPCRISDRLACHTAQNCRISSHIIHPKSFSRPRYPEIQPNLTMPKRQISARKI